MPDNEDPPFARNPQIIFEPEKPEVRTCPQCNEPRFNARRIATGMMFFTCLNESCRYQWQGGLPRIPEDPRIPKPPMNPKDKPPISFEYDPRTKDIIEIKNPIDLTQEFRKGALIPEEDDEW